MRSAADGVHPGGGYRVGQVGDDLEGAVRHAIEVGDRPLDRIRLEADPDAVALEPIEVPPRKTDLAVEEVVLAWMPVVLQPRPQAERGVWG